MRGSWKDQANAFRTQLKVTSVPTLMLWSKVRATSVVVVVCLLHRTHARDAADCARRPRRRPGARAQPAQKLGDAQCQDRGLVEMFFE